MLRILIYCLFILPLLGCRHQSLNNKFDEIELECGVAGSTLGDLSLVKILSKDKEPLTRESSLRGIVEFRLKDGSKVNPKLNDRGCTQIPKKGGQLLVAIPGISQSAVVKIEESRWFERVILDNDPVVKSEVGCPAGGVHVSRTILNPFNLQIEGSAKAISFGVYAIEISKGERFELFRKNLEDEASSLPRFFDTEKLAEGSYRLIVEQGGVNSGWSSAPMQLNSGKECLMFVNHRSPINAPDRSLRRFGGGEELKFLSSENSKIRSCIEKSQSIDQLCKSNSCELDASGSTRIILAPKSDGYYSVWTSLTNLAGLSSEKTCYPIQVTNAAPSIDLAWETEELNLPPLALSLPLSKVKLKIDLSHPFLSEEDQLSRLRCKAEYLVAGKTPVRGAALICRSKECSTKSLEDFVSCGNLLEIDLQEEWPNSIFAKSLLKVSVRSDNGAGASREAQKFLWINESRWVYDEITPVVDSARAYVLKALPIEEEQLLATTSKFTQGLQYTNGVWNKLDLTEEQNRKISQIDNNPGPVKFRNHQISLPSRFAFPVSYGQDQNQKLLYFGANSVDSGSQLYVLSQSRTFDFGASVSGVKRAGLYLSRSVGSRNGAVYIQGENFRQTLKNGVWSLEELPTDNEKILYCLNQKIEVILNGANSKIIYTDDLSSKKFDSKGIESLIIEENFDGANAELNCLLEGEILWLQVQTTGGFSLVRVSERAEIYEVDQRIVGLFSARDSTPTAIGENATFYRVEYKDGSIKLSNVQKADIGLSDLDTDNAEVYVQQVDKKQLFSVVNRVRRDLRSYLFVDWDNSKVLPVPPPAPQLALNHLNRFTLDNKGQLYLIAPETIYRLDGSSWKVIFSIEEFRKRTNLSSLEFTHFHVDADDFLWTVVDYSSDYLQVTKL